jgi:hypothetical protein
VDDDDRGRVRVVGRVAIRRAWCVVLFVALLVAVASTDVVYGWGMLVIE